MFFDIGHDAQKLERMTEAFRPWLESKMASGEYLGWLAIAADGSMAAGVGLWLMEWPLGLTSAEKRRGRIFNVYTELTHRCQRLARLLMNAALE
jgi:hypothetical protein